MDIFLLHARMSGKSGRRIARCLNVPCGNTLDREVDIIVRWGSVARVPYRPRYGVVNSRRAVLNATQKYEAMVHWTDVNVPVPNVSLEWENLMFPMLGRAFSHRQGRDIKFYNSPMDITDKGDSDFYVQYVPKIREFRVHIGNGKSRKISEKYPDNVRIPMHSVVWNFRTGFRFRKPNDIPRRDVLRDIAKRAVSTLGLDFGAVDVIMDSDGNFYVLEVNTAPGTRLQSTRDVYERTISEQIARYSM